MIDPVKESSFDSESEYDDIYYVLGIFSLIIAVILLILGDKH